MTCRTIIKNLSKNRALTAALVLLSSICLGFMSLCFTVTEQRWRMFGTYLEHPLIILLNLLPVVMLSLLLWLITDRAIAAYSVTAVLLMGLTLANWYKLHFRSDPLMFEDLLLAKEAGNMLGRYSLFMTGFLAVSLAAIVLGGAVIFFLGRGRLGHGRAQVIVRALLSLALLASVFPLSKVYLSYDVYTYSTKNNKYANQWSATQQYYSKGFVYPFIYSIRTAVEKAPGGYSKKEAEATLARYQDEPVPENKRVDIIGIMLEAYNDFSKYEQIPFAQDPYEAYHKLEAESYSGNLVTNCFAGGTVRTERSFLTGFTDMGTFRRLTNSYPWYLRSQGYQTTGSHPCYEWFYNRLNVDQHLGFQSYYFKEGHYELLAEDGGIARDPVLFPEMRRLYEEDTAGGGAPYFSFSVTYQGHGPYKTDVNDWGTEYLKPGIYSAETENIFNNYLGSVRSTGEELAAFVDSFREQERPVVIVVFGDHNPWLGDGNTVYSELGLDIELDHKEGFMNYYSTRYLIWANDAAKQLLGGSFQGAGPDIAPCFLMNEVFRLCGWRGPAFMQYLDELRQELPVIHATGAVIDGEGNFFPAAEGELREKVEEYKRLEYYMKHEFLYSDE